MCNYWYHMLGSASCDTSCRKSGPVRCKSLKKRKRPGVTTSCHVRDCGAASLSYRQYTCHVHEKQYSCYGWRAMTHPRGNHPLLYPHYILHYSESKTAFYAEVEMNNVPVHWSDLTDKCTVYHCAAQCRSDWKVELNCETCSACFLYILYYTLCWGCCTCR